MNSKAEALASAKARIIALQSQISSRILQMAKEVEKLLEAITEQEAREFLRATCNVPSTELSTYVRFGSSLRGREDLLQKNRVSFPVLKALVGADEETRSEVLERMEIGARIDLKGISIIQKRLREARLTPEELIAEQGSKITAAAARKRVRASSAAFLDRLHSFVSGIIDVRDAAELGTKDVRQEAGELRTGFEDLFGLDHRAPEELKPRSAAYELSVAYRALTHLEDGTLPLAGGVGETDPGRAHPWLQSLNALTGRALPGHKEDKANLQGLPPAHERLTVVEICAGAGGMSIGLERAGFEHIALIEYERHAAATLRRNRPDWTVIKEDLRKMDFRLYRQLEIDLVSGGPPCQPYSSDGYGLGKDDPRDLLPECVRIVDEIRPKAFLFENVDGLLQARHSDHVAEILRGFRRAGYEVDIHRIQAEDYGLAQERSRVLIVGIRRDLPCAFRMPPTFPQRRTNLGDVLVDLMAANGWEGAYAWARGRRETNAVASTIVTRRGKPRAKEAARWGSKGVDIAGLPETAPTREQAARPGFMPALTARMRARLQDFPDEWEFVGGKQATADQIGNAVPPRMAQAIGLSIHGALKGVSWDWEAMLWPEKNSRRSVSAPALQSDYIAAETRLTADIGANAVEAPS
ncbi:DNA cytosine methyltransferase [Rhizobium leguminosarum bv. viciae]|uniref:DNA cytosine methyltransferase n=1 Tax=Rhizobium leguminosarum TaxID=384 RepID=UPI00103F8FEB|nr:DNA cytosine methyltransferase [Rhizobium leguminosarum]TBZ41639.1 DNA cytosine methyltransferase [Rhizobium leguminosarum bv. viciae]